jgi:hypothetical protein
MSTHTHTFAQMQTQHDDPINLLCSLGKESTPKRQQYAYLIDFPENIVTCQPIVGLRNRALLGSRPLNASRPSTRCAAVGEAGSSPRSRDDVTQQHWNTVPAQQAAMMSHGSTLISEASPCKHSDLTQHNSHLARCCSDTCTIEDFKSEC